MDEFAQIAQERTMLADVLDGLTEDQWQTQSLCSAWTVHDVAAHLLMPLVTPTYKVIAVMALHRMNWDRANLSLTAAVSTRSNEEIVAGLCEKADSHFTPPGLGPQAPLTDVVVHGQDIRRPLGISRDIDPDRQLLILDFLTGPDASKGFSRKSLLANVKLHATDLNWTFGDGEIVSGPAEAIMMSLVGRGSALADLSGDGVAVLEQRLATH